ncbi:hypothetical protein ILUMI_22613 [Ignelater luminosus]|uniref:Methyltransferase HEMK2 n=1 Tax=Ignelater luminosus TaxID=2038154 RepID=A0A8K0CCF2_IGNLU|nr:hypothetical protein ILUMI_22613 [Ignelater luminosus]
MSLPTPLYDLKCFPSVYEPSEDTFLFIDALETEMDFIKSLNPTSIIEVGSGNGVVITSLAAALKCTQVLFAIDINPLACLATEHTAHLNKTTVECLNMDLLSNFKDSVFDIILFNPPYVVTESEEIVGQGLSRAWAGGINGREIIDKFLPKLRDCLHSKGVCYMITIKENKPDEIKEIMLDFGFKTAIVKERKVPGEHLFVLKFWRG